MVTEYTSDPAGTKPAPDVPTITSAAAAEPKVEVTAAAEEEKKNGVEPQQQKNEEQKLPAPAENGAVPTALGDEAKVAPSLEEEKIETTMMDTSPEKPKPALSESSVDESPAPSLSSDEEGSAISLSPMPSPTEPNPSQDE